MMRVEKHPSGVFEVFITSETMPDLQLLTLEEVIDLSVELQRALMRELLHKRQS